jgi:hypothetical protein
MSTVALLSSIASVLRDVNAVLDAPADDPRRDVVRARVAEVLADVNAAGATADLDRSDRFYDTFPRGI